MDKRIADYLINEKPHYRAIGKEIELFEAAMKHSLPMVLKGPTGCGKTRFVEYMAWQMRIPLITLACNEDMTAADLVGRYLLDVDGTVWQDGPLTLAVRYGAICYLDEVVEARQDTTVVIHPLTDERRILPLDKRGEIVRAHPNFRLVVSYNPGYQSAAKDLKPSTKQRFGAIDFDFPVADVETEIVMTEGGVDAELASKLVGIAAKSRALRGHGLEEGISTRMLVQASKLIADGVCAHDACRLALTAPITDDPELLAALEKFVELYFGLRAA
ncbi:nitric oxide reductase NorQ protein [Natronocella acetinitrilica]|uniref:Nitric oxide reductase NorQ protein n=1 Tax=Natronocella acetinitrilica TaxID=414046 RepID=A0AAE3KDS3_9GAMM|nr:CbbQ/NirQ/NorQ/GpvN family protein [Natronocella acetinitrilica]MCP1677211.1 nitric oxide reductase NorQ protein [Natronocella acetinitrilica]